MDGWCGREKMFPISIVSGLDFWVNQLGPLSARRFCLLILISKSFLNQKPCKGMCILIIFNSPKNCLMH